jgi:hypothetical protein
MIALKINTRVLLLWLNFHHHSILVRCRESFLIEKLREEFHFFVANDRGQADVTVDLVPGPVPALPALVAVKFLETAVVYRDGDRKYVDYFGEALLVHDEARRHVEIHAPDVDRLYEIAFLAVHSLLGQELDSRGFVRLHALAVSRAGRTAVVMLPSKGGKSTLLTQLLDDPDVRIVSDDMPLCDRRGRIHPFPSKISLATPPAAGPLAALNWREFRRHHFPPKFTASLAQLGDRLDRNPQDNETFLVAGFRLAAGEGNLTPVPRWKMIGPVLEHMVVGVGLPQVIELFLGFRARDLVKLIAHAVLRARCAGALVLRSRCYHLYLGPDRPRNARLVRELLHAPKTS